MRVDYEAPPEPPNLADSPVRRIVGRRVAGPPPREHRPPAPDSLRELAFLDRINEIVPADQLDGATNLPRLYDADYAILALLDRVGLAPVTINGRTVLPKRGTRPAVVFVCPNAHAVLACAREADTVLSGRIGVMGTPAEHWYYAGRDHLLFAVEADIHHGNLSALALPPQPPGLRERLTGSRELALERVSLLTPTDTSATNRCLPFETRTGTVERSREQHTQYAVPFSIPARRLGSHVPKRARRDGRTRATARGATWLPTCSGPIVASRAGRPAGESDTAQFVDSEPVV